MDLHKYYGVTIQCGVRGTRQESSPPQPPLNCISEDKVVSPELNKQTSIVTGEPQIANVSHSSHLCEFIVALTPESVISSELMKSPPTASKDIEALLAIQDALGENSFLEWNRSTDPCNKDQTWRFVGCTCDQFNSTLFQEKWTHCDNYEPNPNRSRVIYLEIERSGSEEDKLKGTIPAQIGNLKKLRWLNLEGNHLEGEIPRSFRKLKELRYLSLANNRLSGSIPDYFGSYDNLMTLKLHQNNFSGELPAQWCSPDEEGRENKWQNGSISGSIYENPLMCGKVPDCLTDVFMNRNDTWLYIPTNDTSQIYQECDITDPICDEGINGCKVSVPKFWNREDNVNFNFTNFTDPETGIFGYEFNIIRIVNTSSNDSFSLGLSSTVDYYNKTVTLKNGSNFDTVLTQVKFNATDSEKGLTDGLRYKVRLTAVNNGGPPRSHTVESAEVLVDRSPPEIKAVYNSESNETISGVYDKDIVGASWSGVTDNHSNISTIAVFLEIREELQNGTANYSIVATCETVAVNSSSCKFSNAELKAGKTYRVKLRATNGVGLTTEASSTNFVVYGEDSNDFLGLTLAAFIAIVCIGVLFIAVTLKVTHIFVIRKNSREKERFRADTFLKDLIYEVSDPNNITPKRHQVFDFDKDVALVITGNTFIGNISSRLNHHTSLDIENSTAQAEENNFRNEHWPREVLQLPNCSVVKNDYGDVIFRGPRIRIGMHWAKRPGIQSSLHGTTGYRIFVGPEYDLAKQVSDVGNGGQILLTHQAWLELYPYLSQCKFPIVCQIGYYYLSHSRDLQPLYDVPCQIGKRIVKHFPALRRIRMVAMGRGMSIIPFPSNAADGTLTFVAVIMKFHDGNYLPSELAEQVYSILATRAQLFQGSILKADVQCVRMLLAFQDPLNAIRFAHITQISLVLTEWPKEMSSFSGPQVSGDKDIPLFNGPRVAMAIHTTDDFIVNETQNNEIQEAALSVQCDGPGEEFTRRLSEILDGGQIILTERVWRQTKTNLPGQYCVIDHGKHKVYSSVDFHTQLVEITPLLLKGRKFRPIASALQYEKGYFEAPDVHERLAILSIEVPKPSPVQSSQETWSSNIEGPFLEALDQYSNLVRSLLPIHNGYECQHDQRGKFTLAFKQLHDAIIYSCQLQSEMHWCNWSEALLKIDQFGIKRCNRTNRIVKRGLSVKIAIAYGFTQIKEPSSLGRADYFGTLPNLSASLLSMANPGQVLVCSDTGLEACGVQWICKNSVGILPLVSNEGSITTRQRSTSEIAVEILNLGDFLVRGMKDIQRVYQAKMLSIAGADETPINAVSIRNGTQQTQHTNWFQSTIYRFGENYQRLLQTTSFSAVRAGNRLGRMSRRRYESNKEIESWHNGMLKSSPSNLGSDGSSGIHLSSETPLRNAVRASSSDFQPIDEALDGVL
eukprot:g2862.t1